MTGFGLVRHGRRWLLVGAEAERLDQAVAAIRAGPAALLVLLQQRRVVGLGVIAGLDGRAQPDLPGDLAARPADRAGAGLVVLVDLQPVVAAVFGPRPAAEHLPHLGEPLRQPVQRGARDDQKAERGQQREQGRGHPRRERGGQRARHGVAEVAAGQVNGARAVARARRALGDVDQAEHAEQQRGPADRGPDGLGVAVGVPQEPPGQQHREHGQDPGQRAEPVDGGGVDGPAGRVAHPRPQRGREHDGHAQGEQPHAVPAVVRVQVTRAAADGPGGAADRAGDQHPGGRDHLAGPADQDHDGIAGRTGRADGLSAVRPSCPYPACRRASGCSSF